MSAGAAFLLGAFIGAPLLFGAGFGIGWGIGRFENRRRGP
jgi:hypothetical protein